MSKIVWDDTGDHLYETGVKNGVLYVADDNGTYPKGVAWNGLTAITESPSGAEPTKLWADDINYITMYSAEEFGMTVEAYTYPKEFYACDGTADLLGTGGLYMGQQARKSFGLAYKTTVGNDVRGNGYGYKLHLVYGCMASPSEKAYNTINDSPDAITFSWELSTTPVGVVIDGVTYNPTSILTIDSTEFATEDGKRNLAALEDILFGSTESDARLPLPSEVYDILKNGASSK